jgi:large subunit ribosomal protein L5
MKKMMSKKTEQKQEEILAVPRLETYYKETVVPKLMDRFKYANVMMVPRLEKIAVNIGVGEAASEPKLLEIAMQELALREGQAIGCKVTLRRKNMYEFLDRFISLAVPRIRDFRGLSNTSFDGRGNYTAGVREQIIFPEIDIDKVPRISGMDISFVTSANTDEEAFELLTALGMPFKKKN